MLRCCDASFYTGCTNNLTRRLALHRNGKGAKYTRSRLPVGALSAECKDVSTTYADSMNRMDADESVSEEGKIWQLPT